MRLTQPWRIRMLGTLTVEHDDVVVDRFRSQKTGALLAHMALWPDRTSRRSELVELLWPESDVEAGQQSLRVALTWLRKTFEPPGTPPGAVIRTDRVYAGLTRGSFTTDVRDFRDLLVKASDVDAGNNADHNLAAAVELYSGELLPGYFEDWAVTERGTLCEAYLGCIARLIRRHAAAKEWERAADLSWRAVRADPLQEVWYRDLMRLYLALRRPKDARDVYDLLTRQLRDALGASPGRAAQQIADTIPDTATAMPVDVPIWRAADGEPGAQSDPTAGTLPPKPHESKKYHITARLDRFFGREEQIAELVALLAADNFTGKKAEGTEPRRLITLTGPGGTGKTRLALELGARLEDVYPNGALFISLSHLSDARLLANEIRDGAGLAAIATDRPMDDVVSALGRCRLLLILDNLEQFVDAAAPVIRELLQRIPNCTCLATSRRVLGIPGEAEFAVPAFGATDLPDKYASAEGIQEELLPASVRLFADRARASQSNFQLTKHNIQDVHKLCRALDGMPLAIELAAARSRVLSPAQMLCHLPPDRFTLLVDRTAGKDSRHRSLRATIEWSVQSLSESARLLFAQMSVFRGGWTLQAATEVCNSGRCANTVETLDLLEHLRCNSLIFTEQHGDAMRFGILETLREFGALHLTSSEMAAGRDRHAAYYQALVQRVNERVQAPDGYLAYGDIDVEADNLRSAMDWLLNADGPDSRKVLGLKLASSLAAWWTNRGMLREALRWIDRALSAIRADDRDTPAGQAELAEAFNSAGAIKSAMGLFIEAQSYVGRGIEIWRRIGNQDKVAEGKLQLAFACQMTSQLEQSESLLRDCLEIYKISGQRLREASTLSMLGGTLWNAGDLDGAREQYHASMRISRTLAADRIRGLAMLNLSLLEQHAGKYAKARELSEEVLAMVGTHISEREACFGFYGLGLLECREGRYNLAYSHLKHALAASVDSGDRRMTMLILSGFADVSATTSRPANALRILASLYQESKSYGYGLTPQAAKLVNSILESVRAALTTEEYEAAWADGLETTLDETIACALREGDASAGIHPPL